MLVKYIDIILLIFIRLLLGQIGFAMMRLQNEGYDKQNRYRILDSELVMQERPASAEWVAGGTHIFTVEWGSCLYHKS